MTVATTSTYQSMPLQVCKYLWKLPEMNYFLFKQSNYIFLLSTHTCIVIY